MSEGFKAMKDRAGGLAVAGDFETGAGGQAQGEQGGGDERRNFHWLGKWTMTEVVNSMESPSRNGRAVCG